MSKTLNHDSKQAKPRIGRISYQFPAKIGKHWQVDRFPKGSPAPYHLILGIMDARDFAIVLNASDCEGAIADAVVSPIPSHWYKFQRLAFVSTGDTLPMDAISTESTDWWFSTMDMDGFIDEVLTKIEQSHYETHCGTQNRNCGGVQHD